MYYHIVKVPSPAVECLIVQLMLMLKEKESCERIVFSVLMEIHQESHIGKNGAAILGREAALGPFCMA